MSDGETPGAGMMTGTPGACPEIQAGGKIWKVGHPRQAAKGRLERLAKKVALDEVRAMKGILDPAAYKEAFEGVTNNLRKYDTWREGWQAVVFDPNNSHLFLWSLLQEHHPDITEAQVLEICTLAPEEVRAAFAQVIPDFFQVILKDVMNRLSPDQLATVTAALDALRDRLTPTPANISMPSENPTKRSAKSRGAARRSKSTV